MLFALAAQQPCLKCFDLPWNQGLLLFWELPKTKAAVDLLPSRSL